MIIVLKEFHYAGKQNINGMAQLKRTEFGKVNLDYVLGIGGFDLERLSFLSISLVLGLDSSVL